MNFCSTAIILLIINKVGIDFVSSGGVFGKLDRFGRDRRIHLGQMRYLGITGYENPNGATIIKESRFEIEYILGRKVVFFCTAIGNPRPQITWYKYDHYTREAVELYDHNWMQIHEWVESETRLKSKFEIDPATQMDRGDYECLAENKYGIDRRRFRADYEEMD